MSGGHSGDDAALYECAALSEGLNKRKITDF